MWSITSNLRSIIWKKNVIDYFPRRNISLCISLQDHSSHYLYMAMHINFYQCSIVPISMAQLNKNIPYIKYSKDFFKKIGFVLYCLLLITFVDSLVPEQATTKLWAWSGSKIFDTLVAFLYLFLKKVDFEKKISRRQKAWNITYNLQSIRQNQYLHIYRW